MDGYIEHITKCMLKNDNTNGYDNIIKNILDKNI